MQFKWWTQGLVEGLMTNPKRIVGLTLAELRVKPVDFSTLEALALTHKEEAWSPKPKKPDPLRSSERKLVTSFKRTVKSALFRRFQGSFCCYCSIELQNSQRGYDAEHVISKNNRSKVVFSLSNLAISCQPCNTTKSNRKTTISIGVDADDVLIGSVNYLIVHPHYDVWSDYFYLDKFRRVVPSYSGLSLKGINTIEMCGIERLNAIRLAQHFDWIRQGDGRYDDWMNFYQGLFMKLTPQRRKKLGIFARTLLVSKGDPAAGELNELLKDRIDELLATKPAITP
jgi:uncharacterized protein (TIGR02646 family)